MWRWPIFCALGLTILTLLVVELTLLEGTALAYSGGYPDPFELYEAITPGQPVGALQPYPCRWQEQVRIQAVMVYCEIAPQDGPFWRVMVFLSLREAEIRQLIFGVDGLYLGDLVLRWGYPYVVEMYRRDSFIARWRGGVYAYIAPVGATGQYSYWSPVTSVSVK